MPEIISYQPKYAEDFKNLNIAWLEKYFVVEPYDDGITWGIQTVAIATPDADDGDQFPVVIVDLHEDDQAAMSFALSVFDALKNAGRASGEDVCQWRRSLFTLVPNY